jgi:hypothetical protein
VARKLIEPEEIEVDRLGREEMEKDPFAYVD